MYIDYILLHSKDQSGKDMLELIEKLLKRVIESGAKIKVAKSEIMQTAIKYLGFLISDEGIKTDSRY